MSQWCHSGHTSIAAMEDVLISALQHYAICPRQCALIHLEQVWVENMHTAQGRILHEFVHSGNMRSRNGVKIITDIDLYSERLGIRGKSDVVELHYNGQKWLPYPVEYKKGRPHGDCYADSLQLCGQALCLEEMFGVYISEGSLFYGTPHKRIKNTPVGALDGSLWEYFFHIQQFLANSMGYTNRCAGNSRLA